jgi:hypothetical protein
LPRFRASTPSPVLSIRPAHLPDRVPPLLITKTTGAGLSYLLAIAYDSNVLGLGPDSPWDDQRCPGTLRLSVCLIHTDKTLLIPAFALLVPPPFLTERLRWSQNAPLPSLCWEGSMASVDDLSLDTLSVPGHSTSELLRTLSMMAASKPTSWLFGHPDPL